MELILFFALFIVAVILPRKIILILNKYFSCSIAVSRSSQIFFALLIIFIICILL